MAQPAPYITAAEASETLVHMLIVAVPTWLIAPTAARKTSARINPYSTAVAALVDRISLLMLRIVPPPPKRSEEHTSELQSLMRISYAVFCLKKKKKKRKKNKGSPQS